jgi:predicted nucleic-acid-binding protein
MYEHSSVCYAAPHSGGHERGHSLARGWAVIALNTNVLVRYIAQDDPLQSRRASDVIEKECREANPGFIGLVVPVELVWVAKSCYAASSEGISAIVRQILNSRQLVVQNAESV